MTGDTELLQNISPKFFHIVERLCTPAWKIEKDVYNWHNLILIYDGEAVFNINGNEYIGTRGSLVYFKPGDLRAAYTIESNLMKCFAVDFDYTCPLMQENCWELCSPKLPLQSGQIIQDPYLFSSLVDLFDQLTRAWISGGRDKTIRCRAVFMEIIRLLLVLNDRSKVEYSKYRKVEKVIDFMTENYSQHITLKDLADVSSLSPSYLGTIFREVTGKPPIEYLIGIRVRKAGELLTDGCTVSEAGQRLGFSDVYYFSKCFKKWMGVAPSQYAAGRSIK